MILSRLAKTAAAMALITALPAQATAAAAVRPAQSLPSTTVALPTDARAGAALAGESEQWDGISTYILPAVIIIALGLALYFSLDDGEGQSPNN